MKDDWSRAGLKRRRATKQTQTPLMKRNGPSKRGSGLRSAQTVRSTGMMVMMVER